MRIATWIEGHHRFLIALVLLLSLAGAFSATVLPVSLFPQISFPRVVVSVEAGDMPVEQMAMTITWPVEEAVRSVPGVRKVRSTTSRGSAEVAINFDWGLDMIAKTLEVQAAISGTAASLPMLPSFEVRRMDPTIFPAFGYSLTSDTHSSTELRDIAKFQIQPILSGIEGVAKVGLFGGDLAEFQVVPNPQQLAAYGFTLAELATALSASNVISAVGRLEADEKLYLVLGDSRLHGVAEIEEMVIRKGDNGLVYLRDLASVEVGTAPRWTRVTADSHEAVLFGVYRQPGSNTVAIKKAVESRLEELQKRLSKDIAVANWYDQSGLILDAEHSVRDAVIIGIFFAALVLLVFLRSFKVTLIAMVIVPVVLTISFLALLVTGMSLNVMTLGGMAAAVGLIIDDAIVVIEHIVRRFPQLSGSYRNRALTAAAEFTRPLLGSSLSTVIIFAPLAFLSGVTGAFFKALSLTMAVALIVSFFVAWLVLPLLAGYFLGNKDANRLEGGKAGRVIHRWYSGLVGHLLRRPWVFLLAVLPLFAFGGYGIQHVGSGFFPATDEGGFVLDYRAASGTSLGETDRLLRQVEAILVAIPEVETYSRRTGMQLGGGLTEANEGDFFIRLKGFPRRGIEAVMDEVRARIELKVPGLEVEMVLLMEDVIGDLTAVPQPIEIKLFSTDMSQLLSTAPKIAAMVKAIPGVVDVKNGVVLAGDALAVRVNPVLAAVEGMTVSEVTAAVDRFLNGDLPTAIPVGPRLVPVRVWGGSGTWNAAEELEDLQVQAADGHLFPLGRVASVLRELGQPQLVREDMKQMIAVTGRISGRDMVSTVKEIQIELDRAGTLPAGIYYELGGLYQEQQVAMKGLLVVLLTAILLICALLLYLYDSLRVVLAILGATSCTIAGVFLGLWLTGTELNISAMMGITMIVGISTEVSIFYYSELHSLLRERPQENYRTLLVEAGRNRMLPIAMTTFAAMFSLAPLAVAFGQGSGMLQPLAIAIEFGLLFQLPMVLLGLPWLLSLFGKGNKSLVT